MEYSSDVYRLECNIYTYTYNYVSYKLCTNKNTGSYIDMYITMANKGLNKGPKPNPKRIYRGGRERLRGGGLGL